MSASSLVLLAVAAGELATATDVDAILRQLSPSRHHDPSWVELSDALLDQRNLVIKVSALRRVPELSR
jgi:hypothetical protein